MKTIIITIFYFLSMFNYTFANAMGEIEVGSNLRDVPMSSFTGSIKKFSEYRGKPLIINVWASWCEPCRDEMASIERLSRRFGGKQFNVIGISTDDDASAAAAAINQSKLTFTNYLDHHVILESMLGANTIPLTILVDENGRVVRKIRGSKQWDSLESLKLIRETFRIKLER